MNANERNEIVKLIQPNILPNAVEIEVKVTDDEQVFGQYASNEMVENVDEELANLDVNIDDDEENEEVAIKECVEDSNREYEKKCSIAEKRLTEILANPTKRNVSIMCETNKFVEKLAGLTFSITGFDKTAKISFATSIHSL